MQRKATGDAISSGSRHWGTRAISASPIFRATSGSSFTPLLLTMFVRTPPGATQLTRTLSLAHSTARLRVTWFMAALLVAYMDITG